jgi:hypothetical protein
MTPAPEEQADALLRVESMTPGGPLFVQLVGHGEPVFFGPYDNPGQAHLDAVKVRKFLAEVICRANGGTAS